MTDDRKMPEATKELLDRLAAKIGHKRVDDVQAQAVLPFDGPKTIELQRPQRRFRPRSSTPALGRPWYVEKDK